MERLALICIIAWLSMIFPRKCPVNINYGIKKYSNIPGIWWYSPVQSNPLPWYPCLHLHLKDPSVLRQSAWRLHLCVFATHSFTSRERYKCLSENCWNLSFMFVLTICFQVLWALELDQDGTGSTGGRRIHARRECLVS